MNPKEFFRGTRPELDARGAAERLGLKQNLSRKEQKQLETARKTAGRINRRRFLAGSGAIVVSAAIGSVGWLVSRENANTAQLDTDVFEPTPNITPEPEITNIEEWGTLSSFDRLQKLFRNNAPEIEGFDELQQVLNASAEYYCSLVESNFTPEELIERTSFLLTKEEYVEKAVESGNVIFGLDTEKNREEYGNFSSGFTVNSTRQVYINLAHIIEIRDEVKNKYTLPEAFRKSSILNKNLSYVLLHEFGHVDESDKEGVISPTTITSTNSIITIDSYKGINMKGVHDSETGSEDIVMKCNEVLIDSQAEEISKSLGNDLLEHLYTGYDTPRIWINDLLQKANVSFTDLNGFITGRLSFEELMVKLGSINLTGVPFNESEEQRIQSGARILALIGLSAESLIDPYVAADALSREVSRAKVSKEFPTPTP